MKKILNKEFFISFVGSFKKDIPTKIYSIVLAIIVWFIVSSTLYPDISQLVSDVPITIANTSTNNNQLKIIYQDDTTTDVKIRGNRSSIGSIKASDIEATISMENINDVGKYVLPVTIKGKNGKVFDVESVNPTMVNVEVDKIVSKTFEVLTETPNIKAEENFQKSDAVANPNIITITGPKQQIEKITKCVIRNTDSYTLSESSEIVTDNELVLYNNSTIMSKQGLTIDNSKFAIQVPISMKKVLPLKPSFQNVPPGFPIDELKYTIDVPEIEVAAPNSTLQNQGELHLCYIDIHKIDLGQKIVAPIELPEGYRNLSGILQATITFDTDGFSKKTINIGSKNISVINAPANYSITPMTSGFNVPFIGPSDIIKDLTVQDVVAQLDLSSINFTGDEYFSAPVSIFVPNKGLVWTYDNYTATFRAQTKK